MTTVTILAVAILAESYIPMSRANRRSAAILKAIAERFGYGPHQPSTTTRPCGCATDDTMCPHEPPPPFIIF